MNKRHIKLTDGSGGLNDRDNPATLPLNQFAKLENIFTDEGGWPGKKRMGAELIQHSPINPVRFENDSDTFALYHLDESGSGATLYPIDSSANNITLNNANGAGRFVGPNGDADYPLAETGLFGNGYTFRQHVPDSGTARYRFLPDTVFMDNSSACTFEAWVKINSSYRGGWSTYKYPAPSTATTIFQVGYSPIIAFLKYYGFGYLPIIDDGFGLFLDRDYDEYDGKNTSDPYPIFVVSTYNNGNRQSTEVKGTGFQCGVWNHIKAKYNSSTGLATIEINGFIVAQQSIVGSGAIYHKGSSVNDGSMICMGGNIQKFIDYFGHTDYSNNFTGIDGMIDEARISTIERNDYPFQFPRGLVHEFSRSDGLKQAICAAGDSLYYSLGDGVWKTIGSGYSESAMWDAKQVNDTLLLTNGVDKPLCWDGDNLFPWGEGTANVTAIAQSSGGNLSAGSYRIAYTFVYGDYETGPSVSTSVVASSNGRIDLADIPIGPATCTARKVYRQKVGQPETASYYLDRIISDNVTTELSGIYSAGGSAGPATDSGGIGVADSSLGTGDYIEMPAEVATTAIPKMSYINTNHNRIFGCGISDRPYDAVYSELGAPHVFKAAGYVSADGGKGPLTTVDVWYGDTLFSKDGYATVVLRGDNPSSWDVFETLHPTVGNIDHWGAVHHVVADKDQYILAMPTRNGFYGYAGSDLVLISDVIRGTTERMTANTSTKGDWLITNQDQFLAQEGAGGGVSQNIRCDSYATDGIRQTTGQVELINQFDYLGLWDSNSAHAPGNPIAVCKGTAEGEFFFSTDQDSNYEIYHTTDNFKTASVIPGLSFAPYHVIEMVYMTSGTPGSRPHLMLFGIDKEHVSTYPVSDQNSSSTFTVKDDLGAYWVIDDPLNTYGIGPLRVSEKTNIYFGADISLCRRARYQGYFQSDLPDGYGDQFYEAYNPGISQMISHPYGNDPNKKHISGIGNATYLCGAQIINNEQSISDGSKYLGKNIYINHIQKASIGNFNGSNGGVFVYPQGTITGNSNDHSSKHSTIKPYYENGRALWYPSETRTFYDGFYSIRTDMVIDAYMNINGVPMRYIRWKWEDSPTDFAFFYTIRTKSILQGEYMRPQAWYDPSYGEVYFTYAGPENGSYNRTSYLVRFSLSTMSETIINNATTFYAHCEYGGKLYYANCSLNINDGVTCYLSQYDRALGQTTTWKIEDDLYPTRLQGINGRIYFGGKQYWKIQLDDDVDSDGDSKIDEEDEDYRTFQANYYNHQGLIGYVEVATQNVIKLHRYDVGGNVGPYPADGIAMRLAEANGLEYEPKSVYFGISNANDSSGILARANDSVNIYKVGLRNSSDNINGPLIFVPSSGVVGNYLWADRLYFGTSGDYGTINQLGVQGDWQVQGYFESGRHDFGVITNYAEFEADLDKNGQTLDMYMRQADTSSGLIGADYIPIVPNHRVTGLSPAKKFAQWRAAFAQSCTSTGALTESPTLYFVNVRYFIGASDVPRIMGVHYKGRSYWAVSVDGSMTNNLVLCYQRNRSWTHITNWPISGFGIFRNELTAMIGANWARLLKGTSDLGKKIVSKARTGTILGAKEDKCLREANADLSGYVNPNQHGATGWMKLSVLNGDTYTSAAKYLPIPEGAEYPLQVKSVWENGFVPIYARALALELSTSDHTGIYASPIDQEETIMCLLADLWVSGRRPANPTSGGY